jgi:hypothetical protein
VNGLMNGLAARYEGRYFVKLHIKFSVELL